jgi:hypothetical protein
MSLLHQYILTKFRSISTIHRYTSRGMYVQLYLCNSTRYKYRVPGLQAPVPEWPETPGTRRTRFLVLQHLYTLQPYPYCDGAATARGGSGGEAVVAAKQRRREVGCFLARAADPAGEGNRSDAEAWRRRTS